jgi:hypothetical protein
MGGGTCYPYSEFIYNFILKKNNKLKFIKDDNLFDLNSISNLITSEKSHIFLI